MALGKAIRKARIEKGWSQETLAARCELSREYLVRIERGHVKLRILTLVKMANALGMTIARLLQAANL